MKIRHPDGRELDVTEQEFVATHQAEGFVPVAEGPDLAGMKRDELNEYAASVGVEDAASLPNKQAVIDAINERQGGGGVANPAGDSLYGTPAPNEPAPE
jgi:hypothetical protein